MKDQNQSPDIAFFLPALNSGGAEKNTILLAQEMCKKGLKVEILVMEKTGAFLDHVPTNIKLRETGKGIAASTFFMIKYVRRYSPRCIVAGLPAPNIVAITAGLMTGRLKDIYLTQHHPFSLNARHARRSRTLIAKLLFPVGRHFICVCEGVARDLEQSAGVRRDRITVIPNPVDIKAVQDMAHEEMPEFLKKSPGQKQAVIVGRLAAPKDLETPLRALQSCSGLNLVFCGEGPERKRLELLAGNLNVQDKVIFTGFLDNPYAVMAHSDLLILSSEHEGFGNVLIEAMALGAPVIATDCPYGPSEILEGGRYGSLIPVGDSKAMARAIQSILQGKHPAGQDLKKRAGLYDIKEITRFYLDLLNI